MPNLEDAGYRPMDKKPKADKVFPQNTTPKMVKADSYVMATRDEKPVDKKGSK